MKNISLRTVIFPVFVLGAFVFFFEANRQGWFAQVNPRPALGIGMTCIFLIGVIIGLTGKTLYRAWRGAVGETRRDDAL